MRLTILRTLAEALGPNDAITLGRDSVRELLADVEDPQPADVLAIQPDMTVPDVAAFFAKAETTVRDWCRAGHFEGAYLLNGREWRIPRAGFERFIEQQRGSPDRERWAA